MGPTLRRDRPRPRRSRGILLTDHALRQMRRRGIPAAAIDAALDYGRVVYTRGAVIQAIGRNEIARWSEWGIDLSAYDGIQVVCSNEGAVLTVYRNRNFRLLRTGLRRGRDNRLGRSH
jgi:Domain of unknown function (DUF4258)